MDDMTSKRMSVQWGVITLFWRSPFVCDVGVLLKTIFFTNEVG